MTLVYTIIGFIWFFSACFVLSALMLSSRANRQFEDIEDLAELDLVWNVISLENHKQITLPSSQVNKSLEVQIN